MKQHSLLLSSLTQRLILALTLLAILWGVYFWAIAGSEDEAQFTDEPIAETVVPE